MGVATAVAPVVLALAIRDADGAISNPLLVIAALLWIISLFAYRGFSLAHERWRRNMLRREIAETRKSRLDSSEAFQDRLNEQFAILDRIVDISDSLLADGIVDPSRALDSVRLVNAHAHQAQGLVENAVAEARIETGSQNFNLESVDVRTEIEHVVAPFIRSGQAVTTSGAQHFAHTDAAVFRLLVRAFVSRSVELGAEEIDVSVARDGALVVCTVADDGPDRSELGLDDLSPLATSLAVAVDGEFEFGRTFGWNQYSIGLPVGVAPARSHAPGAPMDVLGSRTVSPRPATEVNAPAPRRVAANQAIAFPIEIERDQVESVAARRKSPATAR